MFKIILHGFLRGIKEVLLAYFLVFITSIPITLALYAFESKNYDVAFGNVSALLVALTCIGWLYLSKKEKNNADQCRTRKTVN